MLNENWDEEMLVGLDAHEGAFDDCFGGLVEVEVIIMSKEAEYARLLEEVRLLPDMTVDQRKEQAMGWTYGNLAIDCPVSREAFRKLSEQFDWSTEQFDAWAAERKWDLP